MMPRTLKDMVVVITGASAGIGKALAQELHQRGAKLVLAARRLDRLNELNASLGGQHLCVGADVSRIDGCRGLIEQSLQRFSRIDTLVCNAGYGVYEWVSKTTPDQTRRIFETNVYGTTDCIHLALPAMMNQSLRDGVRGQIMVVSSCVGRRGMPFIGIYSATKAAQLAMSEALRVELRPFKIPVTTVHPIHTSTEFGQVAQTLGQMKVVSGPMGHTAGKVARKMVRAIIRPRPEVWPSPLSRIVFGLGTLMPRLVDLGASAYRRRVQRLNPDHKQ